MMIGKMMVKNICVGGLLAILATLAWSCNKDDEVRAPENILGYWMPDENTYLEFSTDNAAFRLKIEYQDGESIGEWSREVYYYEPGYNLVIYLTARHDASVYQIVDLTSKEMTWCWVKDIEAHSTEEIGKLIGEIINEAQEGFKLDPENYQSFRRLTQDEFFKVLESLDIEYPW